MKLPVLTLHKEFKMKIENTPELLAAIEKNDELTAQLKDFEATKESLSSVQEELENLKNEMAAVQQENTSLKEANDATAEVGEQIKAEVAKVVELTTEIQKLNQSISDKDAELAEMMGKVAAFEENAVSAQKVAEEAVQATEELQEQFEVVSTALGQKGGVPVIEEVGTKNDVQVTWKKLALSNNPENRRAARKMAKENPEILASIINRPLMEASVPAPLKDFSEEEREIFDNWDQASKDARHYEKTREFAKHAEAKILARKIYKQNQSTIDRFLANL